MYATKLVLKLHYAVKTIKMIFIHFHYTGKKKKKKRKGQIKSFSVYSLPHPRREKLREMHKINAEKEQVDAIMNLTPPSLE